MYNKTENDFKKNPISMNDISVQNTRKSIPFENNKTKQSNQNNVQNSCSKKKNDELEKNNNEELPIEIIPEKNELHPPNTNMQWRVKYEKSEKSCKTLDFKIEDQNQEIIKLRQEKNDYLTNLNNLNRQIKDLNYQNEQIKIEYQKLENKINSQSQVHKKDLQNYEKTVNEYELNNAKIISQNESIKKKLKN